MYPDQDEFLERLYQEHYIDLFLYARALLGGMGDPEEIVQDAFHTACGRIGELMASPNPVGWMKLTVKHTVFNYRRRRSRELQLVQPLEETAREPGAADGETEELLLQSQCRALLSDEEYALVRGVVLDGVPYAEMAERQGIGLWACYKRVKRSLDKLARGMQDEK